MTIIQDTHAKLLPKMSPPPFGPSSKGFSSFAFIMDNSKKIPTSRMYFLRKKSLPPHGFIKFRRIFDYLELKILTKARLKILVFSIFSFFWKSRLSVEYFWIICFSTWP